jgi:hypothetical protein
MVFRQMGKMIYSGHNTGSVCMCKIRCNDRVAIQQYLAGFYSLQDLLFSFQLRELYIYDNGISSGEDPNQMTAENPFCRNFRLSSCIVTVSPGIVSGNEYYFTCLNVSGGQHHFRGGNDER